LIHVLVYCWFVQFATNWSNCYFIVLIKLCHFFCIFVSWCKLWNFINDIELEC
jgi:hypothetical protein